MGWTIDEILVPSSEVHFWRSGTAFTVGDAGNAGGTGAGTASITAKPGATDPAWPQMRLGSMGSVNITSAAQKIEVFGSQEATYGRLDTIYTKQTVTAKFTAQNVSWTAIELAFGTQALSSGVLQGNPMRKLPSIRGWLKVAIYQQGAGLWLVADMWGTLTLESGLDFNPEAQVSPAFSFDGAISGLNSLTKQ